MVKVWTPERRAAQAERIRATKPWLKSTGPRTRKGKRKSSQNARKHGNDGETAVKMRKLLNLNRAFLALVLDMSQGNLLLAPLERTKRKMKPKQFPKLTAIFSRKNQLKENRKGKAKPPS